MGFGLTETLVMVLLVNITAAVGAFGFGYIQDRIGHKLALALTLLLWIAMVATAASAQTSAVFWVAANLAGTRILYTGYPLVDLICDKEQSAPSDIYLAEIYDDSGAELLRGLSLYRLIDEMVIFLLPVISSETVPVSKHISTDKWELVRTKTFRNGICRLTYRKTLQ